MVETKREGMIKLVHIRAVPRILPVVWGGQTLHTPHRGLRYTDKVSTWTFLFSPLHRKLPLRPLKKTKHTDAFCLKLS